MHETYQNIILDLDETLIKTVNYEHENKLIKEIYDKYPQLRYRLYNFKMNSSDTERATGNYIELCGIIRPYAREFLKYCFKHFKTVSVWSAGTPEYVNNIVNILFNGISYPTIVFDRTKCNKEDYTKPIVNIFNLVEDLSKVINNKNTFFIDDREDFMILNKENAINIPPYNPNLYDIINDNDDNLLKLMRWFDRYDIKYCRDVSLLNKNPKLIF